MSPSGRTGLSRAGLEQLADAIESASEGVSLFDAEDRLVTCNARYRRDMHVGMVGTLVPGARFEDILRAVVATGNMPEALGREEAWIGERLAARRAVRAGLDSSCVQRRNHGNWVKVDDRRVDGGGIVSVYTDITALVESERAARDARDEAVRATRARAAFLATMSHEIRTPMNGVIGTSHLLLDTELSDEQRALCTTIVDGGDALLRIVDDVLDYSKAEAGALELTPEVVDLRACIDAVLAQFVADVERTGLALRCRVEPSVPDLVLVDGSRLRQVLVNLVGNAFKFTERGGIAVEVQRLSGRAAETRGGRVGLGFDVIDTGPGVDPAQRRALFRPFVQGEATTSTRRRGGTGLGLTIARNLVELMGGTIVVGNTPGGGATFRFTASLAPVPAGARAPAPPPPAAGRGLDPHTAERLPLAILLVDDDAANRELGRRVLARLGYEIRTAASGDEAIERHHDAPCDLILMDIEMPGMDGIETARRIRNTASDAPAPYIVAMTANAMRGDRERYLSAGMDDYRSKPLRPGDFVEALEAARHHRLGPRDAA